MKIGITCYPTLGGSGVVATELGKMLAEKGHCVHFITHSVPFRLGRFHRNVFYHEVEVNDYPVFRYPPYDLALASRLAQVAQMQNLDILHVHYALPHAVAAYLAKQMVGDQLKVVTTLHGTDITVLGHDPSLRDLIRFAIHQSDTVTAVSNHLIEQTKSLLSIEKEIKLVYNFVDNRDYFPKRNDSLRQMYASDDEKVLIHISNFRAVKRTMDVIDIFANVQQTVPSKLILIGEGPDLCSVHQKVQSLGLADRVHFLGKQDDVSHVLSLADLMLLPSENESFGLVALEAMACGVPTVGSRAGGIPEVVVDGETGLLSEVGDIKNMSKQVIRLLMNPSEYERMRRNGLERAEHYFSSEGITAQYETIYAKVLGRQISEVIV